MNKENYTEEEIKELDKAINTMSHEAMAIRWRFSKSGDPYFRNDLPLFDRFSDRFQELGGMTVSMSKRIGWEE